jgi:energy-coupling factor transporter transmembrane protein EcfT
VLLGKDSYKNLDSVILVHLVLLALYIFIDFSNNDFMTCLIIIIIIIIFLVILQQETSLLFPIPYPEVRLLFLLFSFLAFYCGPIPSYLYPISH